MADFISKFLCFIFLSFNLLVSQSLTNFEIVDSLINSIVSEISTQIKSDKIKFQSNLEDKLIENRILNRLIEGFTVFINDSVGDAYILRFDGFRSKIYYVFEPSGLFKKSRLKRNIEVDIYCSAVKEGKIVFSDNFKREFSDYVSPDDVKKIEDKSFKFTRGEFVGNAMRLRKIFEVFFVVSSVGVAIYLLFALRK